MELNSYVISGLHRTGIRFSRRNYRLAQKTFRAPDQTRRDLKRVLNAEWFEFYDEWLGSIKGDAFFVMQGTGDNYWIAGTCNHEHIVDEKDASSALKSLLAELKRIP